MNLEKQYISQLLSEIEEMKANNNNENGNEALIKEQEDEISTLKFERDMLNNQVKQLGVELKQVKQDLVGENKLKKELKDVKEKMRKPAVIKDTTKAIDVLKNIKEGNGCIQPINPTVEGWKQLSTYPFTFELGNMGCVFEEVQLKGCFERTGINRKYYYHDDCTDPLNREIVKQILGMSDNEAMDCHIVTKTSSKRGRKLRSMTWKELLKKNISFNVIHQKFVSDKDTKFVYTANDGSKYIINEKGEEEIL